MVHKIKSILSKKETADSFVRFVPILITIILAGIIVVMYIQYVGIFNTKDEVDMISRRYIIKMETTGYLTPADADNLVTELESLGIYDIDLTGTTLTPVSYGHQVDLVIKGKINFTILGINGDMFDTEDMNEIFYINIDLASTAQQ